MKNYFDLRLSGSKLFPYIGGLYIAFVIYFSTLLDYVSKIQMVQNGLLLPDAIAISAITTLSALLLYIFAYSILMFFIAKESIVSLNYKGEQLRFDGTFSEYFKIVTIGILLTIITLGIYGAWFYKRMAAYFARYSSYDNLKFRFEGKGLTLLLMLIIPSFIMGFISGFVSTYKLVSPAIHIVIMILNILYIAYLIYQQIYWITNFKYNGESICLKSGERIKGILFMLPQIVLSIVSFGLYLPAATIVICRYFIRQVELTSESGKKRLLMNSDITIKGDFLYILGQLLLTIITLGIYAPWLYANVSRRIINKSYIEE